MSALIRNLKAMSPGEDSPPSSPTSSTSTLMASISPDSSPASIITGQLKTLDLNPGISPPSPPSSPPPPIPTTEKEPLDPTTDPNPGTERCRPRPPPPKRPLQSIEINRIKPNPSESSASVPRSPPPPIPDDPKDPSDELKSSNPVHPNPKAQEIKEYCVKANHERHIIYDYGEEEVAFQTAKEAMEYKAASSGGDNVPESSPEAQKAIAAANDYKIRQKILGRWNYTNKPSQTKRSDGVGWIVMKSPKNLDVTVDGSDDSNDQEIRESWEKCIKEGEKEEKSAMDYFEMLKEIALKFEIFSGKWLFHIHPDYVDLVWFKIIKALHSNAFPDYVTHAKVSPVDDTESYPSGGGISAVAKPGRGPTHVVCIYNKNFTESIQVETVHDVLRKIGLLHRMMYKPDIFSVLGIYRNNELGLRPTIYWSSWDNVKHAAKIENVIATIEEKKIKAAAAAAASVVGEAEINNNVDDINNNDNVITIE